MVVSYR